MVLSLDKINRWAMLHRKRCIRVAGRYGTKAKPLGELGRFGGWFEVADLEEARSRVSEQAPYLPLRLCVSCSSGLPLVHPQLTQSAAARPQEALHP